MDYPVELISCPFCGCHDIDPAFSRSFFAGEQDKPMISAGCNNCGVCGPSIMVPLNGNGYAESSAKWNNQYANFQITKLKEEIERANRIMCAMASDLGEIVHLCGGDEHSLALPLVKEKLGKVKS